MMNLAVTSKKLKIERTYLLYQFCHHLSFVGAIWLYFYRLFITDAQIGVLDGMAFFIGLIAEVPSGALADKYGRSIMTRLGLILAGCGILIQALGGGFLPIFIGQSVMMIGMSFMSGADEALFFSKLNYARDSTEWRRLVTRGSQMTLAATLVATLLGAWLYTINPYIPWVMNGIAFFMAAFFIWRVKDTIPIREKLSISEEVKTYFENIFNGFKQFGSSELLRYVPLILTVQALFYVTGWGLLRLVLLGRFHFDPLMGAVVITVCSVLTIGVLWFFHRYAHKMNERAVLFMVALLAAISLLVSIPNIGFWGAGVIFALYAGDRIFHPFLSDSINKHANEKYRATTLSVASFFKVLPYIGLGPLIGILNGQNHLHYFLFTWPILIGLAVLFYLFQSSKKMEPPHAQS